MLSFKVSSQNNGTFIDKRDGQSYNWVKIGSQIWMAENLKFKIKGSSYYDLYQYGRLYTYETAIKICPSGWHLPSDNEWKILESILGMNEENLNSNNRNRYVGNEGKILKSKIGWRYNGNGIDKYGFKALPGGFYQRYSKKFLHYGSFAYFWTSTSYDEENAIYRTLGSEWQSIDKGDIYKVHGLSCRCLKD